MKVVTEEEKEEGKAEEKGRAAPAPVTMVVAVKLDAESKELLTWALMKLAASGDRVVALHILPPLADGSASNPEEESTPPLLSLAKGLGSMAAVYEGFCNLKQIDLKWNVCRSPSIRKELVREVKSSSATKLVLGVPDSRSSRTSIPSVVKYCARKLPCDCQVLAVRKGKIIFQKQSVVNSSSEGNWQSKQCGSKHSLMVLDRGPISASVTKSSSFSTEIELQHKWSPNCTADSPTSGRSQFSDQGIGLTSGSEFGECGESSCSTSDSLDSGSNRHLPRCTKKQTHSCMRHKHSLFRWVKQLSEKYASCSTASRNRHRNSKLYASNLTDFNKGRGMASVPTSPISSSASFGIRDGKGGLQQLANIREKYSSVCQLFSYKELKQATSDFSTERLVGKGGNSRVYRGSFPDGKELAVKVLKPSGSALKEFASELEIVTTLSQKNIIALLGFCVEIDSLILVYDFFPMGSLEQILHGREVGMNILKWVDRYNVSIRVAEALCYLHGSGSAQPVIHRDVKTSNILLAECFEPQLSDFGLARRASNFQSHVTCSDIEGTFGYLAPEYLIYGKANEKVDVYAFGVVLLELISGRKPISTGCNGQESLVVWVKAVIKSGRTKELVDPCLNNEYDDEQLERMVLAASLCIRQASRTRPRMGLVLKLLQGDENAAEWSRSLASFSLQHGEVPDDETTFQDSSMRSHLSIALHGVDSLSP